MIRYATLEDIPALRGLILEAYEELGTTVSLSFDKCDQTLVEFITADKTKKVCLVSDVGGVIQGFLGAFTAELFYSDVKQAYELMWYVGKKYRSHKDGWRLFLSYELWAKGVGCDSIHTSSHAKWGNRDDAYAKRGYEKTETAYRKTIRK